MPTALEILAERRQRQNTSQAILPPEDVPSDPVDLLKQVGGYGLTAIGAVGNVLDLPGSTVRDLASSVLTGKFVNPFDQWLSPFSSDNRTTGRDLLTQMGARRNRESTLSDWMRDPTEAALDIGGFFTEMALDPFNPAKWALGSVGGLNNVLRSNLAKGARGTAKLISSTPVVGAPISRVAGAASDQAQRMYNYLRGGVGKDAAKYMEEYIRSAEMDENQINSFIGTIVDHAKRNGWDMTSNDPDSAMKGLAVRAFLEGDEAVASFKALHPGAPDLPDVIREGPLSAAREWKSRAKSASTFAGLKHSEFYDPTGGIEHAARYMGDSLKELVKEESFSWGGLSHSARALTTRSGQTAAREMLFKGIKGGTPVWETIVKDDSIQKAVEDVYSYTQNNLVQEAFEGLASNTVTPRYLDDIAETLGKTGRELWTDLGLDLAKPYTKVEDITARLAASRKTLIDAATAEGRAEMKVVNVYGKFMYDNLLTGKGTRVKIQDGQFMDLPPGQSHVRQLVPDPQDAAGQFELDSARSLMQKRIDGLEEILGQHSQLRDQLVAGPQSAANDKSLKRLDKSIAQVQKELASAKGAPARFEEALTDPQRGIYVWKDKQGVEQFYSPRLVNSAVKNWPKKLKKLGKQVAENPVREEEMAQEAVRHILETKYGDYIDDNMPHINSDGTFGYLAVDVDGNTVRPLSLKRGTALEFDTDPAFKQKVVERVAKTSQSIVDVVPRYDSRIQGQALLLATHANIRTAGMFTNSPIVDLADSLLGNSRRVRVANAITQLATDSYINYRVTGTGGIAKRRIGLFGGENTVGPTLDKVLRQESNIDRTAFVERVRSEIQRQGKMKVLPPVSPLDEATATKAEIRKHGQLVKEWERQNSLQLNDILQTPIDAKIAQELDNAFATHGIQQDVQGLNLAYSAGMNIFKAGTLSTPRTVVRDALSASFMSLMMGDLKLNANSARRVKDAAALSRGRRAAKPITAPDVLKEVANAGLDPNNPEHVEQVFVSMYAAATGRISSHAGAMADDVTRAASGQVDRYLDARPQGMIDALKNVFGENIVKQDGQFKPLQTAANMLNPMRVAGSITKEGGKFVQQSKSNAIAGLFGTVRGYFDNTIRMSSILNLMDEGMDFKTAFERVAWHQVNYDPRRFSGFEKRWMKKLFPFYSFISRSLPMVANELATNPGGPLGQVVRAQRLMQSGDTYVPYDLQDSAAIPLGTTAEGDLKYLTNLGLMHEDAIRFIAAPATGAREMLQKVIGSTSPFVKGVIEYGTNTSTFFDGPMGGRRLDDLDPAVGRILANLGITEVPPSGRPKPFGGPLVESVVANSPAAAALSYLRVMSESRNRRSMGEKAFNLITGLRTRIFTDEMMSRELRDRLNAEQIKLGARPVSIVSGTSGLADRYAEAGQEEEAAKLATLARALDQIRKKAAAKAKQKKE